MLQQKQKYYLLKLTAQNGEAAFSLFFYISIYYTSFIS